jgi:hypothetical protein
MITPLHPDHFPSLFNLSEALRSDHSPRSYWSVNLERASNWLEDEKRTDLVTLKDGTVTGIAHMQQGAGTRIICAKSV